MPVLLWVLPFFLGLEEAFIWQGQVLCPAFIDWTVLAHK